MAENDAQDGATGEHAPQVNETEDRARRMGWVPKEEFRGDPDRWRPADEFLARGENILPVLQERFRSLEKKFEPLERENRELKETLTEVRDFSRAASEREYKRARADIQAEITAAAQQADPERASRAVAQLEALDAGRPAAKTEAKREEPKNGQLDPEIQAWIGQEKWFTSSPMLSGAATEIYGELERTAPGMSTAERLAETKRRTVELFPDKFGVAPTKKPAARAVGEPSGASTRKNGKTYDDLPPEAKRACDKFVKTIKGYKREDYVRDYDWGA